MSNVSKRRKEGSRAKIKSMGDHQEFLRRITKTLYYAHLPTLPCLSLPVTEVSCEVWSAWQRGRSLRRLHADAAAGIARGAGVSPCALVLALLYLERLHACNPDYLTATPPADLFLVSLMVGNKFLQDDGEDDEILCCEWAASGGLDLQQLNKLEVEFLTAIDWNIFVNEDRFELGLRWLERRVALKQAQLRGFFTYTELSAAGDAALLADLIRGATAPCLAAALGYLTSLLTLVTSTLLISQAWLPALHHISATTTAIDSNMILDYPVLPLPRNSTLDLSVDRLSEETMDRITDSHMILDYPPVLPSHLQNSTLDLFSVDRLAEDGRITCCTKWQRYQDPTPKHWYDSVIEYEWKMEPWWSKTSVLNWLYQRSLVDPMQRWLERINEYADFFNKKWSAKSWEGAEQCEDYEKYTGHQKCVRQWLNLSKLSALVASVSDR